MQIFYSYILKIKSQIIFLISVITLMTCILMLNNVESAEILYGDSLLVFVAAAGLLYGYYKHYQRYKYLKDIGKNIEVSINNLPEPEDCIEEEYQQMIKNLSYYYNGVLNKNLSKFSDMEEYYTMWIHQIKTPIAAMKLLLQEKEGGSSVSYEQAQLFKIEQYAEMALQYIRLGSESTDFVIKKVDVHSVVKEAVYKYARMFIQKKIKLDFADFDVLVVSDEKWLEFVIEQILSNAVKYTNKGGVSIYIECNRVSGNNGNVNGISVNGILDYTVPGNIETVLVIKDTGIGINSADLPRICEKGYTGYNGHDDKLSTGIGLYMCSKILKKLSHRMEIESEEGKGTKVRVIF